MDSVGIPASIRITFEDSGEEFSFEDYRDVYHRYHVWAPRMEELERERVMALRSVFGAVVAGDATVLRSDLSEGVGRLANVLKQYCAGFSVAVNRWVFRSQLLDSEGNVTQSD